MGDTYHFVVSSQLPVEPFEMLLTSNLTTDNVLTQRKILMCCLSFTQNYQMDPTESTLSGTSNQRGGATTAYNQVGKLEGNNPLGRSRRNVRITLKRILDK
jgi:hypothetical protein